MRKFLFLSLIFFTHFAFGQYFSDSTFKKQLTDYLKPVYSSSKQAEQQFNNFLSLWDSDLSQMHTDLLSTFNQFYKIKIDKTTVFDFILATEQVAAAGKLSFLKNWNLNLQKILSKPSAQVVNYITGLKKALIDSILSYNQPIILKLENGSFNYSLDKQGNVNFSTSGPVDLYFIYSRDTVYISGTTGSYSTSNWQWQGNGGKLIWTKFRGDSLQSFVVLHQYKISTTNLIQEISDAEMTIHRSLLHATGLKGKLVLKFSSNPQIQKKSPVFEGLNNLKIPNIVKQGDFEGKIVVNGQYVNLKGEFNFKLHGDYLIFSKSDNYLVTSQFIKALGTSMRIKVGDKAIMHSNVNMLLLFDTTMIFKFYPYLSKKIFSLSPPRVLTFYRETSGPQHQPFLDYYHKLLIYSSEILWLFNDSLYFVQSPHTLFQDAYFVSMNYFGPEYFNNLIDYQGRNYPVLLYQYWAHLKYADTVYVGGFYGFLRRLGIETTKKYLYSLLEEMSWRGWFKIKYNTDLNFAFVYDFDPMFKHIIRASIRPKLVAKGEIEAAKKHSSDFDIIKIKVNPVYDSTLMLLQKLNTYTLQNAGLLAILNLKNNVLHILKPDPFYLSRVRNVIVKADTLLIKKDLNMSFSGKVRAGLSLASGDDFNFNYNKFQIDLNHIKTYKLWCWKKIKVPAGVEVTPQGDTVEKFEYKYEFDTVQSYLNNFKGRLDIDFPQNKSGLLAQNNDGYPSFTSLTNSKIYYFKAPVDTSNFYFLNYPFTLKNLNALTDSAIAMTGKFHSSILADIDSLKLTLQDDKSLGFIKYDTTQGFKIFGGAKLLGYLKLDNSGLHSVANLKFLSSIMRGSFDLRPDQLLGKVDSAVINPVSEQERKQKHYPARYPYITFRGLSYIHLLPETDTTQVLIISQKSKEGFHLYPNFLRGDERGVLDSAKLWVDYTGVRASGIMDFIDAQLKSNKFILDYNNFYADTCQFDYKDSTFKDNLFNTRNVSCYMDLTTRVGTFISNDVNNYITFPKNRYIVYSDHFLWKINKGLIDIGGDLNDPKYVLVKDERERDSLIKLGKYNPKFIRLSGTKLISMKHKNQVNFEAARTVFDPNLVLLRAFDVPELDIADTKIIPAYPVNIRIGGVLDTLPEPKLYVGPFRHKIQGDWAFIKDSKYYVAAGYYTYKDTQRIYFQSIKPTFDTISEGIAHLKIGQRLYLNKYFYYQGPASYENIELRGDRKFLNFKGKVGIYSHCDTIKPRLVVVDQPINPDTVMIKVDFPVKGTTRSLWASPVIHKKSIYTVKLLNAFLTPIPNPGQDRILSKVKGYLYYSPLKSYYIIGSKQKVLNPDTSLPMVAFDYKRCFLFTENNIDLQINYGPDLKYKLVGKYIANLHDGKARLNDVILQLNFPYINSIFTRMIKDLNDMTDIEYTDLEDDVDLKHSILLWAKTEKEKRKFIESQVLPSSMAGTIVLGNVYLKWDPNRSSFRTVDDKNKFSVLYINGKEVDINVKGYIELRYERKKLSRIYIYFDLGDGNYYFFRYLFDGNRGFMNILTSSGKPEEMISQMKDKDRNLTKHFQIGTAEKLELQRFLNLYKQQF